MDPNRPLVVLGRNGQVGWELIRSLGPIGPVIGLGREDVDLEDSSAVRMILMDLRPRMVINAAAYTAVDKAESEPEAAANLNSELPHQLAVTCKAIDVRLVHFSTDYVFDGTAVSPYREVDRVSPRSVYGKTKYAGEMAVLAADPRSLVIRLSWVYGSRGKNFLLTMRRLAAEGKPLRVVDDQIGAPTSCRSIAEGVAFAVRDLDQTPAAQGGLYHLAASGQTTWYEFAKAIFRHSKDLPTPSITPITTREYPTPAQRPAFSVLNSDAFANRFKVRLPHWEESLKLVLEETR